MTYDYFCKSCEKNFEFEQSIKDDPLTVCPKCGADSSVKRLITGGGFVLKGRGWAADNYSSKNG
jgi:putative FmdB family regulatory protein